MAVLRIAVIQMEIKAGDPEANYENLERLMEKAVSGSLKPDVIMAPELWNTGYALERLAELADPMGQRTKAYASEFCRKHGVHLVAGSVAVKNGDRITNTVFVFDSQGACIGEYDKIHLFRLMDEEKAFAPGTKAGLIQIEGIPAGLMVCYDIRFPELSRKLALAGARICFVPAQWPKPRLHHWRTLLTARAIENQMFVAACNRVGVTEDTEFFGHSMVIDPWGEVLSEGGEKEEILFAELDLDVVDQIRRAIPVFEDRQPEWYK